MHKNHLKLLIFALVFIFMFYGAIETRARTFNPNYIISDEEILDEKSMTIDEIFQFLKRKGSYLSGYQCPDADGNLKWAAEIIHNASAYNYDCSGVKDLSPKPTLEEKKAKCVKITINPKFLLVLLQKEQSLIDDDSPTERQLNFAAGYGCPDSSECGARWRGFGKQVNSAALQFYDYMVNPHLYTYKKGGTYTFSNPYGTISKEPITVTPYNQATAALYNYTPHVYNGNYNFFKIWQRFFTRLYPDGSLLQAKGKPGVWLIELGKKRPFLTKGALTSRHDTQKIIIVEQSDLDNYDLGNPIKYPQYSILRSPKGTIYLLDSDTKRGFASQEAFRKIGINPEEIIDASLDDLAPYREGAPITAQSAYPTGALLQNMKTGGVYFVSNGDKSPVWDRSLLKYKFRDKKIIAVKPQELDKYKTIDPERFGDGELLRSPGDSAVYLIAQGKKLPFLTGSAFEKLGYKWKNVIMASDKLLTLYPQGDTISDDSFTSDAEIVPVNPPQPTGASSSPASTTPEKTATSS